MNGGFNTTTSAPTTQTYRFFWLHSFDNPIVVRIWLSDPNVYLVTKQLDGDGGDHPGKLVVNRTRSLSSKEWDELLQIFNSSSPNQHYLITFDKHISSPYCHC